MNQTYQNLEIILVDDGSPDACGMICDKYATKDNRIKVFHKQNGGLSDARNFGIVRAKGSYLGFVDSDDWIEPDMYEILVNRAEESKVDIVNCGFYQEYPNQMEPVLMPDKRFDNSVDLVKRLINVEIQNGVWHKLFRKECFSDISFPFGHVYEDVFIIYKIFLKVTSVLSISKPLYHYRVNRENSITNTYSMNNLIDLWLAYKSRYDYLAKDEWFNTDIDIMDKLQQHCAVAIARTWRWCYANPVQERERYVSFFTEMQEFSLNHFPCLGEKGWPLYLRFSIFLARYNNAFVFALLYYLNQGYRRLRKAFRVRK